MLTQLILSGLIGWFGVKYIYSQFSSEFKQKHPSWVAAIAGGVVGFVVLPVLNVVQHLLAK